MAPYKRTQPADDSTDIETLESASSSLRQNNKRLRLSEGVVDLSDDVRSEGIDPEGEEEQAGEEFTAASVRELFDMDADQDSGEGSDDESAMAKATQRMEKLNARQMENRAAEGGVIESVTCVNFMCHSRLHVALGPLINFIIGHNGSGKSAVLTAITLCLGGKATSTNRGQNLKAFIKEGTDSAQLTVKLKNQGSTAYRHDIYGDSIIIERHFSLSGTSGFKIKNSSGRIMTTKRAELDEITDFYNLQIDNPVNVLTQDQARQFLNNSTPTQKYKFFIEGVQLERLHQDYDVVMDTLDAIGSQLQTAKEDCEAQKVKAEDAKEKLKLSDQLENLRDKVRKLSRQMAWAQVEEQERILEKYKNEVQKAIEKIEAKKEAANEADQDYDRADNNHKSQIEDKDRLEAAVEPLLEQKEQASDAYDKHKSELYELQASHREIKGLANAAAAQCTQHQKDIDEEQARLEAANGGGHAAKLLAIEGAEQAFKIAKERAQEHAGGLAAIELHKRSADLKANDYRPNVQRKRDDMEEAKNKLRSLQQDQGQQNGAYDRNIDTLLRAIQQENRFREKPIGPVGNYVRLKKPQWSSILERTFGGALDAFVVTSKADQKILSELVRRCKVGGTPILIGRSNPIDTSGREPDERFDTILRTLEISNDLVRNQLIINQSIENVILFENSDDGTAAMFGPVKPQNVRACLVFHPTKRGVGIRYRWGAGGGPASDPLHPWPKKPRMRTDIEYQVNAQREIVKGLEQEYRDVQMELKRLEDAARRHNQDIVKHKTTAKKLELESQRAEETWVQLKDELESDVPQDGKLDALKQQLVEAQEEKEHNEAQLDEAERARRDLAAKATPLKAAFDEATKRLERAEADVKKAGLRIARAADDRNRALQKKNAANEEIKDAEDDKEKHVKELDDFEAHVADFVRQATQVCARVPVDRGETADSLDRKMSRITQDLRNYDRELGGDQATIARKAREATVAYRESHRNLHNTNMLNQKLLQSIHDRKTKWLTFRRQITARARAHFMYLMSERAFYGKMIVSHSQKMLDLQADPEVSRRSSTNQGRQTKSLSGGEKSFSTICMLLALWDAMGSPIRCLDEFDVFMDSVNRDVSMRMMIAAARRSVSRQYILITPQAMNNVDAAGDVKIIRLSDPERGQTTLEFPA